MCIKINLGALEEAARQLADEKGMALEEYLQQIIKKNLNEVCDLRSRVVKLPMTPP